MLGILITLGVLTAIIMIMLLASGESALDAFFLSNIGVRIVFYIVLVAFWLVTVAIPYAVDWLIVYWAIPFFWVILPAVITIAVIWYIIYGGAFIVKLKHIRYAI